MMPTVKRLVLAIRFALLHTAIVSVLVLPIVGIFGLAVSLVAPFGLWAFGFVAAIFLSLIFLGTLVSAYQNPGAARYV